MILGIHNMVDAVADYAHEMTTSDRGLSLVLMDGLLLIPLMMAAFFYPRAALEGLAMVVLVSVVWLRMTRGHRHRQAGHPRG